MILKEIISTLKLLANGLQPLPAEKPRGISKESWELMQQARTKKMNEPPCFYGIELLSEEQYDFRFNWKNCKLYCPKCTQKEIEQMGVFNSDRTYRVKSDPHQNATAY